MKKLRNLLSFGAASILAVSLAACGSSATAGTTAAAQSTAAAAQSAASPAASEAASESAKEQMEKDYMYYACLMCKCGDADGAVSGRFDVSESAVPI